jgi:hypothetical protein
VTRTALAASALLLVACATSGAAGSGNQKQVSAAEQERARKLAQEGWICEKQRPLGSNIMEEVCRPLADSERDRDAAQALLRRPGVAQQGK